MAQQYFQLDSGVLQQYGRPPTPSVTKDPFGAMLRGAQTGVDIGLKFSANKRADERMEIEKEGILEEKRQFGIQNEAALRKEDRLAAQQELDNAFKERETILKEMTYYSNRDDKAFDQRLAESKLRIQRAELSVKQGKLVVDQKLAENTVTKTLHDMSMDSKEFNHEKSQAVLSQFNTEIDRYQKQEQINEQGRHNLATELNANQNLSEKQRSNLVGEEAKKIDQQIDWLKMEEESVQRVIDNQLNQDKLSLDEQKLAQKTKQDLTRNLLQLKQMINTQENHKSEMQFKLLNYETDEINRAEDVAIMTEDRLRKFAKEADEADWEVIKREAQKRQWGREEIAGLQATQKHNLAVREGERKEAEYKENKLTEVTNDLSAQTAINIRTKIELMPAGKERNLAVVEAIVGRQAYMLAEDVNTLWSLMDKNVTAQDRGEIHASMMSAVFIQAATGNMQSAKAGLVAANAMNGGGTYNADDILDMYVDRGKEANSRVDDTLYIRTAGNSDYEPLPMVDYINSLPNGAAMLSSHMALTAQTSDEMRDDKRSARDQIYKNWNRDNKIKDLSLDAGLKTPTKIQLNQARTAVNRVDPELMEALAARKDGSDIAIMSDIESYAGLYARKTSIPPVDARDLMAAKFAQSYKSSSPDAFQWVGEMFGFATDRVTGAGPEGMRNMTPQNQNKLDYGIKKGQEVSGPPTGSGQTGMYQGKSVHAERRDGKFVWVVD